MNFDIEICVLWVDFLAPLDALAAFFQSHNDITKRVFLFLFFFSPKSSPCCRCGTDSIVVDDYNGYKICLFISSCQHILPNIKSWNKFFFLITEIHCEKNLALTTWQALKIDVKLITFNLQRPQTYGEKNYVWQDENMISELLFQLWSFVIISVPGLVPAKNWM